MMKKIVCFLLIVCQIIFSSSAEVQDQDVVASLAVAIHRVKTGSRGTMRWRECGRFLTAEEATTRSEEYASYFVSEQTTNPGFDPIVGAAISMQESSLDRCAISRSARLVFVRSMQALYHRDPTEEDIIRLLRNRQWRSRLGLHGAFDAGLVQFRWPGTFATLAGATDAGSLVDARVSIHMLAISMERYRSSCDTIDNYRGTRTVIRRGVTRTVPYSIPCADAYWVQHNSPARFNYTYYQNVVRWARALVTQPTDS